MYRLWLCTEREPTDRLRAQLAIAATRHDKYLRIWLSQADPKRGLDSLAAALESGEVVSAALVGDHLIEASPWVAREWFGALVVEANLLPVLDSVRQHWIDQSSYPSLDADRPDSHQLVILRPARLTPDPEGHTVETAREFVASLHGDQPVEARTTLAAVEQNRRAWFGEFADPGMGGANALLALSGVTSTSTSIVLRNPAALSLSIVTGADALSTHIRAGRIKVRRCSGFQRQQVPTGKVAMSGPGAYAIYVELMAVVDPEVEIDAGMIFEQSTLNDVQTLATAERHRVTVNPGSLVPIAASAWCLNSSLRPPGGEPMNVTPLRYMTDSTTQHAIWDERNALFGGV